MNSSHRVARLLGATAYALIVSASSIHAQETLPETVVTAERGGDTTGVPVERTTAGPVQGYRALTSTSATRTQTPLQETPASVQVITRKLIDDQGATSVSEVLQNVSGVQPLNVLTFGQLNPKVRGFSGEIIVDGLPNYFNPGARDLLVNVERIEVLKGPQGALYVGGANATGGTINIVSKLPTDQRFANLGIMAGGYNYWSPYFDVNQPLNKDGTVLFRFTGQYEGTRAFTDVIDRRSFTLNPTITFTNKAGTDLTIQGVLSRRNQQDYSALPAFGTLDRSVFSIRRSLFPSNAQIPTTQSDIASVTARLKHVFDNTWSSSSILRVATSKFNEPSQGLVSNLPDIPPSTFEVYDLSINQRMRELSFSTSLQGKFDFGWMRNTVLFTGDYNNVSDKGNMFGDGCSQLFFLFGLCPAVDTQMVNFAAPVFAPYQRGTTPYFLVDNRYTTVGATAQLQSTLFDRLHLLASGRVVVLDIHDSDGTGFRRAITGSDVATTNTTKFLPRIGASFDVTKNIALYASYSEGLRPVAYFFGVDPMKPEESKQMEAGVKITTDNGLTGTFAVFDICRRNVPISNGGFGSVQSGEQQAKGFEADILWQPNRNLSFLASYAYTDAKVVEDNNAALVGAPLTGVPKNSGRLRANYTFVDGAWKGLSFGAGVYAASEQSVELGAVWRTPGYATLEAKIAYQYEGWNMALIGRNLTDKQYFVPYQYLSGRVAPGDGRTVFASASRKF